MLRLSVCFALFAFFGGAVLAEQLPLVEIYKNRYCGCCGEWEKHLKSAGFPVKTHFADNLDKERARLGMPAEYASCHTAQIALNGKKYLFEGHVPSADILRLLEEAPDAIGLAVPDMPAGSPGMDIPNSPPFETLLIKKNGKSEVFARHEPK